jgi:hypothetical protein
MPQSARWLRALAVLGLICFSLIVFMGKSYERSLQAMDSSVHARLALDITRGPLHLPVSKYSEGGHWPNGFNDHPFTMFYLSGKVMRALSPSAFSARLLATSFAVGCILLTYALAISFGAGLAPALAAGFIVALTPQFIGYGSRFHLDAPQCFFILLSFYAWVNGRWAGAGLAVGLGLITKTPVCLLLYPSVGLAALVHGKLFRERLWLKLGAALLLSLAVAGAFWAYCAHLAGWEIVTDYFTRHVFGVAADVQGRGYVPRLPLLFLLAGKFHLWTLLFFSALFFYVRDKRWRAMPALTLLLAAVAVEVGMITLMRFRFEHYYMPAYPFAALFIALSFAEALRRRETLVAGVAVGLPLVLGSVAVAFPLSFGGEKFPQLRAFNPLIRATGDCNDLVLFVQGSQPYGSFGDYAAEISFYTNRRMHWATCENFAAKMTELKPAWVIVGEEELKSCGESLRAGYPTSYRYGAQLLLSKYPRREGAIDLTALGSAGSAPADCEPPQHPASRYYRPRADGP